MKIFENLNLQDLDGEIWKDILDYKGYYQISNIGRVKSFKRYKEGRILKQKIDNDGYLQVVLGKNGENKTKFVHRLVYEIHIGKIEESYVVHHISEDDKQNNIVNNLESMPREEHNIFHNSNGKSPNCGRKFSEETKKRMSESQRGKNHNMFGKHHSEETKKRMSLNHSNQKNENNNNSKLKNEEVWLIKKILESYYYKSGKITQTFIGKMFLVDRRTISKIKTGKFHKEIYYE